MEKAKKTRADRKAVRRRGLSRGAQSDKGQDRAPGTGEQEKTRAGQGYVGTQRGLLPRGDRATNSKVIRRGAEREQIKTAAGLVNVNSGDGRG